MWGKANIGNSSESLNTIVNTNLLTNWYFANPVNRRGGFCFVPKGTPCYMGTALTPTDDRTDDTYPVEVVDETYSKFVSNGGNTWYVSTADVKHGYYKTGATIDRWYLQGEHPISLTDAGLKVTCNGGASQNYILKQFYNLELGKTYTLSALIVENTTIEGVSTRYAGLASVPLVGTGVVSRTFTYTEDILTDGVGIQFDNRSTDNGNYFIVSAIKLECGDTQSLAYQDSDGSWKLYEIPSYEEELAKCKAIEPEVNNPNLLHNWYFANPVNRKNGYYLPAGSNYYTVAYSEETAGTTTVANQVAPFSSSNTQTTFVDSSGTTMFCNNSDCKKGYVGNGGLVSGIDKWRHYSSGGATFSISDDEGIVVDATDTNSTWGFVQNIEEAVIEQGKTYTLSALAKFGEGSGYFLSYGVGRSTISGSSVNFQGSDAEYKLYQLTFTVPESVDKQYNFRVRGNTNAVGIAKILAVKLELGDTQTLAHQDKDGNWILNEIPDYQEEYERCSIYPVENSSMTFTGEGFIPASGNVTMTGKLVAHSDTTYNAYRIRNVKLTSSNVTAGTTALENGSILLKYV